MISLHHVVKSDFNATKTLRHQVSQSFDCMCYSLSESLCLRDFVAKNVFWNDLMLPNLKLESKIERT